MNILITGGCGFVGSSLAVELSRVGHSVVCFDNLSRRGSQILRNRILESGCEYVYGDIRNPEDFEKLKGSFELMIECSAEPSVLAGSRGNDALYVVSNNLFGSVHCFEHCRVRNIPVIFLSTSRVYPYDKINRLKFDEHQTRFTYNDKSEGVSSLGISKDFPLEGKRSLYGATKLSSELLLQEYSHSFRFNSVINRCGVIAGPWQLGKVDQGVFTYWLASHYFKKELKYIGFGGKGKQVRDLIHIDDLASLIISQIQNIRKYHGEVFTVGGGAWSNLSLLETTKICEQITGNRVHPMSTNEERPADVIWYISNTADTEREFAWHPQKSAETIIRDTYEWLVRKEEDCVRIFG